MKHSILTTLARRGRSFFVDATAGSDSASGRSPAAAWQTIGKVNAASLLRGDRVLLKCGESWLDSQLIGVSGVTYATYGSGDLPVVNARTAQATAFAATNKSNIILRGIAFKGGTSGAIQFTTCTDTLIHNCEGSGSANDNLLLIGNCARCLIYGGRYYGNLATTPGAVWCGIEVADGGIDIVIDGVTVDSNPTGIGIHNHTGYDVPSVIIRNCIIDGNVVTGSATTNQGIQILCQTASGPSIILIENNTITNTTGTNGDGLRIAATAPNYVSGSIIVRNNTIRGSGRYQVFAQGDDIGFQRNTITGGNRMFRSTDCKRLAILHNTFHETTYLSGFPLLQFFGTRTDTVDIRNNIISSDDAASVMIRTESGVTTNFTINYNIYQQSAAALRWAWNGTSATFANWKTASGGDANSSTTADVLFADKAGNNFALQTGSPAIDAGVVIAGINGDYLGIAPDLGYAEKA